ncbi:hypothetical protein HZA98_04255 [Candidatus Woesearchaeota archaeon]|nr:hypothetical protein [Candidatus Woesearchaeota archaeon]
MKECIIPCNSALAIMDRALKAKALKPNYLLVKYYDTITREKREGILLESIDGFPLSCAQEHLPFLGILGFVNGKEPAEGTIPLHEVLPKENDELALAYIIEGVYKGNFGEANPQGCQTILQNHKVKKTDLEEKEYTLQVQTKPLLSKE